MSPQPESYWGHVNPIGPRSVYDEAKRFAEAICVAYHRQNGVDGRVARIFNTYGSRMRADDGRVVPAFINQALRGEISVLELAKMIIAMTESSSAIEYHDLPVDDPKVRVPDISRAKTLLHWEPHIDLDEGLRRTIDWFRRSVTRLRGPRCTDGAFARVHRCRLNTRMRKPAILVSISS